MVQEQKDKKFTIRISSSDYDYLQAVAYMAGMTVSKYVRTLAQASISAAKVQEQKGAFKLEDIKALLND
uniref:Ribbon-helix-helix protein CopG domain-containing protein n=1 Tax=uncultured prokaryote TaxID=198431 RepID=A0A0H5Q3P1_9ZZZZ|nr:hypothetical protein [uncultured prokaryote]